MLVLFSFLIVPCLATTYSVITTAHGNERPWNSAALVSVDLSSGLTIPVKVLEVDGDTTYMAMTGGMDEMLVATDMAGAFLAKKGLFGWQLKQVSQAELTLLRFLNGTTYAALCIASCPYPGVLLYDSAANLWSAGLPPPSDDGSELMDFWIDPHAQLAWTLSSLTTGDYTFKLTLTTFQYISSRTLSQSPKVSVLLNVSLDLPSNSTLSGGIAGIVPPWNIQSPSDSIYASCWLQDVSTQPPAEPVYYLCRVDPTTGHVAYISLFNVSSAWTYDPHNGQYLGYGRDQGGYFVDPKSFKVTSQFKMHLGRDDSSAGLAFL